MKGIKTEIINTTEQVGDLVDWLTLYHVPPVPHSPTMYIDLEGVNLCRDGSLSILTLMIDTGVPTRQVYLFDVHLLGAQAFNTPGKKQKTLKDILQDKKIRKVFFDVRNDSDALFALFDVKLQGVQDIQLMESAKRRTTKFRKFLSGLTKCVEENVVLWQSCGTNLASWKMAKEKGERLFKPEHGGSYDVFNKRPIPHEIVSYCVGDVRCLPELHKKFWPWSTDRWRNLVNDATEKRAAASQQPEYQPNGPGRAVAPWGDGQNKTLDEWNYVPSQDYFDECWLEEDGLDGDDFDEFWDEDDNDYEDWTRAPWQGPPS